MIARVPVGFSLTYKDSGAWKPEPERVLIQGVVKPKQGYENECGTCQEWVWPGNSERSGAA
ncbi:hypothetical protein BDZ89DRAFT_1062257, partial [Hymenopellis radicata]